jgi:uncharacterized membrane protein
VTRLAERLVKAHHVDAAEFMHLMTVGGSSATPPRARAAPPRSPGGGGTPHKTLDHGGVSPPSLIGRTGGRFHKLQPKRGQLITREGA